jgi:hypothetical protein
VRAGQKAAASAACVAASRGTEGLVRFHCRTKFAVRFGPARIKKKATTKMVRNLHGTPTTKTAA